MPRKGRVTGDLDKFRKLVAESRSYREIIDAYDYKETGGVYKYLRSIMDKHGIDYSHFLGQGWAKGKTRDTDDEVNKICRQIEKPDEEVFVQGSGLPGQKLIQRLLRSGKRKYKCEECGSKTWRGKPVSLTLHHKNEDSLDNRLENLELLCPNCHYTLRHEYGKKNWKFLSGWRNRQPR
jgi:5-methylcytosine-specific restriction endonuclease McrA